MPVSGSEGKGCNSGDVEMLSQAKVRLWWGSKFGNLLFQTEWQIIKTSPGTNLARLMEQRNNFVSTINKNCFKNDEKSPEIFPMPSDNSD